MAEDQNHIPSQRPAHLLALDRVVESLRGLSSIVAIGAYGSTADRTWTEYSDIDLLAVLSVEPPVESLRFFVNEIGVDLNFRSADDTPTGIGGADFVPLATAIWDPDNVLHRAQPTLRTHNPAASSVVRYMLFHDIQKVRQVHEPTARRAAMCGVVNQILSAWFQARSQPFPGIVVAVGHLRTHDPHLLELVDIALCAEGDGLAALDEAAERSVEPIGGVFSPGEVLAISWRRPGVEPVPEMLASVVAIADGQ